jgi:hypothetical protein
MRLAKSEIRGISGEEAIENLVLQPAGRRENDFASLTSSRTRMHAGTANCRL